MNIKKMERDLLKQIEKNQKNYEFLNQHQNVVYGLFVVAIVLSVLAFWLMK